MRTRHLFYGLLSILTFLLVSCKLSNEEKSNLPDWALGEFIRIKDANPIITPDPANQFYCPASDKNVLWESEKTSNPGATIYHDSVVVLYRAEDNSGNGTGKRTSRIGYAISPDGIHFARDKEPVLYPDKDEQAEHEWMGGCEDPRVAVTPDGTYVMLYTQWNRHYPRLAVALSKDLKNWTKYGPVFQKAFNGKYYNTPTKSASIITKLDNGKQLIEKVNGKYFMYWGNHHVYGATSNNLTDWYPLEDENGELKKLFSPRNGYFDSSLIECGPPAIATDKGIVLLYNGKNNTGETADQRFPENSYAAGQALFDLDKPEKLIARLDEPFFTSVQVAEKNKQSADSTVFIEGLVFHQNKWFLYYGCAQSDIGVAVCKPSH